MQISDRISFSAFCSLCLLLFRWGCIWQVTAQHDTEPSANNLIYEHLHQNILFVSMIN